MHGHANEDVFRARLRVLHEHVKVPVVVKGVRIEQFVLELFPRSTAVRVDQVAVGIFPLRVLVEVLHVRVGRRTVDVKVVLLDILAVVGFAVGQPEEALLQDWVPLVPQGQRKTEPLLFIADSPEPVLAPPVRSGACLVMGEIVPGVAVIAVVLADSPPLSLAEVRPPFLPGDVRLSRIVQAFLLGDIQHRFHLAS